MHRLGGGDVVADRTVVQVVVAVFAAEREFGGHEKQFPERMDVLHARRDRKVVRRTVCVGVLLAAVVALRCV